MSVWQTPAAAARTSASPGRISSRSSVSRTRPLSGALATHARIVTGPPATPLVTAVGVNKRYRARRAPVRDLGHLPEQFGRHLGHEHPGNAVVANLEYLGQQRVALGVPLAYPWIDTDSRHQTSHVTSSESGPLTRAVRIRISAPGASR